MKNLAALLHDARWRPTWLALLVVLVCITSWFAFIPATASAQPMGIDKVEHFLAFAALGVAATFATHSGLRHAARAAVGLLLYGGFIELVQTQLPTRQGDWADMLADGVGVAAGLVVAAGLRVVVRR